MMLLALTILGLALLSVPIAGPALGLHLPASSSILLTAFGAFRDEVHAERRAMSRAVILALVVALISMVVSTNGLG